MKEETEKQINTPLAQQDYFENFLEEFEEENDSENGFQFLEEIECEDNPKESDCSAISVNLENEEEYNSDTDINSSEIDELMNMINS